MTPALLTKRSVLPYFSSALEIAISKYFLSVTSTDYTRTFVKSRGKALILSVRRPKSNIGNPSALKSFAIDWCMEGDSTLDERLDFMETHEEQLEEKIKVLEMNLAFLRWKIWYYQTAAEAGTESIHFIPGTTQVKPEIRVIFK